MKNRFILITFANILFAVSLFSQHSSHHPSVTDSITAGIDPQPLLAQAIRLKDALSFLGSSLTTKDEERLMALQHQTLTLKYRVLYKIYLILIAWR